jgi:hypothetical protein
LEATTASILLPLAVSAFSTMDSASDALQSLVHCLPTTLISPLSISGLQDFHLAFAQHLGVVVGRRAAQQVVVALRFERPRLLACSSPTLALSKEM